MDDQSDNLSGSAYRNFLAVLPISDGVVTIRAMSDEDAEAYAAGTGDALVRRFAHLPLEKYSPQIVRELIHSVIGAGLRDGTLAVLTIADSSSDSFLGSLVFFDINQDDAEIGYWVAPEHRGRKVSGRALALALQISRILGLKRLRARTVQDNPASERVLLNGVLSRNRRKFRQPINVACPAPGRWGRPNSRVTSRHFDHGNASRTSRPDCSGLDEAD